MTEASQRALQLLRSPDHFQWYLVPLLACILYVYAVEVQRKNWHLILSGLILSAAEFTWEILNALVLHFTRYSAVWTTPGESAYLILVGLTIEIWMMFFVAGVIVLKSLPEKRDQRVLGLPNRLLIPVAWGVFCSFVEVLLNRWGVLVWAYPWWNWPNISLVVLGYSLPFLLITWVYDRTSLTVKGCILVSFMVSNTILWVIFACMLSWI